MSPIVPALTPFAHHVAAFSASTLPWLDIVGIAVFAASGALAAARDRQTIVTFGFFAAITGLGGGTVRDVLIGAPVFWMHASMPLLVCLVMTVLVWALPERLWPRRALDWFDAFGLAAYTVYGSAKALAWDIPPLPAVGMGVVSACMGGIIRDVVAGVPSILLRPELYVTAAAVAAVLYVTLETWNLPSFTAALIATAAGFALRAAAIVKGLGLPLYRSR
ncbi:trimeric intracellular cation channel family protein [Sphingomonas nostoxanthinifaciens]|uniref:trimeric intracellular cation channel family protein n=1 Tax=Sphingomonas nostoxanthinifaciens TaxID=2872652 RepID=UPI001CC21FF2|nr:TRIC cation channel family protein [Sphingomonas nostoxanthinifaciens]UAK23521.1 TRIC cation channel family protein [Sphingomonas nostoxanthinifaciens]